MVDVVRRARAVARDASAVVGTRPLPSAEAISRFLRSLNIWFWAIVGLPTLIAGVYFFAIASDLYSSEVKFIVRGPPKAPVTAISAMLNNSGENAVSAKRACAFSNAIMTVAGPAKAR